ncbi:MAG: hypothetical protein RIR26_1489 [Pseudomonadota bacterium]|jgi:two-component system nitrogen regulation sensor histidine kinase NtrY
MADQNSKNGARLAGIATGLVVVLILFVIGTWLETKIFDGLTSILQNHSFLSVILFFSILNLTAVLAFALVFLSFRNAVKLVVERQRAVFGSSLRTRLVTLFLFFSLVPTLILLYISTKFVNARFESWLPPSISETTHLSFKSEVAYREKLIRLLNADQGTPINKESFDFVIPNEAAARKGAFFSPEVAGLRDSIFTILDRQPPPPSGDAKWIPIAESRYLIVALREKQFVGFVSPPSIHQRWKSLSAEVSEAQPGVELVRLSYYILLGALSVLLVFSALWLGVTIARELTGPLQTLASATQAVAQGNYDVNIDDVVSDDELGQLARGFRSMVGDLQDARSKALASAEELEHKASLLSEKTEYYASVLQEVRAAVLAVDAELRLEACNPACERLFNLREESVRGLHLSRVLTNPFYELWLEPLLSKLLKNGDRRVEGEFAGRIGFADVQLMVTAIALTKPDKNRAFLVIVEDVTQLARAQRSAAWREVARKVAHEIKNPLTPIKLGAQRLERRLSLPILEDDRQAMQESLGVIVQSADTIKRLVDEFVAVARMPGPRMRISNIVETLKLCVAAFSENPEQIAIELEVWNRERGSYLPIAESQENSDFSFRYDPEQVSRAMFNLISNAVAASAGLEGMAKRIVVRLGAMHTAQNELEISVLDWGHGVPDAVKDKIFEPYFSTKRTGTGLGLVIVQQIVHEHGGRLRVSANEPRGSIFTLTLST